MAPITIDPTRTAVLSMDLQNGIVSIYARDDQELVTRAGALQKQARAVHVPVIHVKVAFRPGLPEISARNPLFGAIKASKQHQQFFEGDSGSIHPAVAPEPGEIVIGKSRVNPFAGTDLEMVLRANDIDTLVIFGIATSGVVLSCLLHASDADYRLFVVKDCCTDADNDLHICLIDKLFPRRSVVVSSEEMITAMKETAS